MNRYRVHTISGAPRPWRVLLGLVAKGVPFDPVVLQASEREHKRPAFLQLNPRGRVPVLQDGDFVLTESIAILQYLEDRHPQPPLFGHDARERARIWQRVLEAELDITPPIAALVRSVLLLGADPDDDAVRTEAEAARAELQRLSDWLGDARFLAGDHLTAVDCIAFPQVRLVLRTAERRPEAMARLGLHPFADAHPTLAGWVKRIEGLPGYDAARPPHWNASPS